jgi:antitoxin component of MazEF toxin-antitoxin module
VPQFRAVLTGVESSSATYVRVPAAVLATLGGRIRVPVRMKINGTEHRTTICDMGMGPMLGVPASVRRAAKIERGDRVSVSIEVDRELRTVEIPQDFEKAMKARERRAYDGMSYSHRKEYVQWIEAAKKAETRARRIALAVTKLRELAERKASR